MEEYYRNNLRKCC